MLEEERGRGKLALSAQEAEGGLQSGNTRNILGRLNLIARKCPGPKEKHTKCESGGGNLGGKRLFDIRQEKGRMDFDRKGERRTATRRRKKPKTVGSSAKGVSANGRGANLRKPLAWKGGRGLISEKGLKRDRTEGRTGCGDRPHVGMTSCENISIRRKGGVVWVHVDGYIGRWVSYWENGPLERSKQTRQKSRRRMEGEIPGTGPKKKGRRRRHNTREEKSQERKKNKKKAVDPPREK